MKKDFFELLEEMKKELNEDVATVQFNEFSIDISLLDDDGYEGYSQKFYEVFEAIDYLKLHNALLDKENMN